MNGPLGTPRVAVTGVGVKSPAGDHIDRLLPALFRARSVAATVPALVDAGVRVTFACTVPEFSAARYAAPRELRQWERPMLLAISAATDAVEQAELDIEDAPETVGVAVGTGIGGSSTVESISVTYGHRPDDVPPTAVSRTMASASAARIAIRLGARGSALTYATACASGATAIGEAALKIRHGELEAVVAGGVDSAVSPLVMSSFARMSALSSRNDDPAAACRPFDHARDGFVMGEGAAFMVLERWDRAVARGATILGEIAGYGSNTDAHHLVAPCDDGAVAARCMRAALDDARLDPSDIGHINAHGTSTALNDRAEARAIEACFGAKCPPVTAPKGVVGHLMGAAGALEAVVSLHLAESGRVPPVANFTGGPDADLIDVVTQVRSIAPSYALSNSFGFGGHNVSLILAPPAT